MLLYRHGVGSVLVSAIACSGLAYISFGQVSSRLLILWWSSMSVVLVVRGIDILHFHRFRSFSFRAGLKETRRFGLGVVASAAMWATFPIMMLPHLTQTGRAYTAIVVCGMVGGGTTVLAPSKTLSLLFCAFLVLPTSTIFLALHGKENTFLGILGWTFFVVMLISSRVANRATMTALRLSRANEALIDGMEKERKRTEAANVELKATQVALSDANRSLERRVELRTADLQREMKEKERYAAELQREMNEKERYARELAQLACTDPLTGLHNRASLRDRLSRAVAEGDGDGQSVAVLFLDLDKFKEINDLLGHIAGDRVLRVVAERLQQYVPPAGELARWGGDEFVIVLPALKTADEAANMADVFSRCLSEPIQIETGIVRVDATIGIAIFPDHGRTEENLIRAADIAMYTAKEERRSRIRLFDPVLGQRITEVHLLEHALRDAVEAEAFSIVFQPIVSATSGACEILEALARWHHPERGVISPNEFIPLAERTGEIIALGRWVLDRACRQAASWPGSPPPAVSVNVSAVQVEAGTIAVDVANALRESSLPPARLQLELTESVFAGDRRNIIPDLVDVREMGVRISLDDFGTGFSCLADLRRLPIDQIKIDKSFVESLELDSAPILKVIMTTAQTFGLKVVAEGVETPTQAKHLTDLGAHYLQGYLFSNVLAPEAVKDWLLPLRARAAATAGLK